MDPKSFEFDLSRLTQRRFSIPSQVFTDLEYVLPSDPERIYLFLHGYCESGNRMLRKLGSQIPKNTEMGLLAPNGPYLVPFRQGDRYRLGYSWYFYDFVKDEYLIDMKAALDLVVQVTLDLKVEQKPVTLIGYSQGGYLAPFLAERLPTVDHIIGMGCEMLVDEIPAGVLMRKGLKIDQIHGADDAIVNPEKARAAHRRALERGGDPLAGGYFYSVPGEGHDLGAGIVEQLGTLLRSVP